MIGTFTVLPLSNVRTRLFVASFHVTFVSNEFFDRYNQPSVPNVISLPASADNFATNVSKSVALTVAVNQLPAVTWNVSPHEIVCVLVPSDNVNNALPAIGSTVTTTPVASTQIVLAPAVEGVADVMLLVLKPDVFAAELIISTFSLNFFDMLFSYNNF
jgi:hypothetical protein